MVWIEIQISVCVSRFPVNIDGYDAVVPGYQGI